MYQIHRMLLKNWIGIFTISLIFFISILLLADIFSNLSLYIESRVGIQTILSISFYYLPKAISFSIPISLLFSLSFVLGYFYFNNEFIAVLGSGMSLFHFISPFIFIGSILSLFLFFFEDSLVIDTFKIKNELTHIGTGRSETIRNQDIVVSDKNYHIIYNAFEFIVTSNELVDVKVIYTDENYQLLFYLVSERAIWIEEEKIWRFINVRIISSPQVQYLELDKYNNSDYLEYFDDKKNIDLNYRQYSLEGYSHSQFNRDPKIFLTKFGDSKALNLHELFLLIQAKKDLSFNFQKDLTQYYRRFSFSLIPLIIILLAGSFGGQFKNNILLSTLSSSLIAALFYYILDLICQLIFQNSWAWGAAWIPIIIIFGISFLLFKWAPT